MKEIVTNMKGKQMKYLKKTEKKIGLKRICFSLVKARSDSISDKWKLSKRAKRDELF